MPQGPKASAWTFRKDAEGTGRRPAARAPAVPERAALQRAVLASAGQAVAECPSALTRQILERV